VLKSNINREAIDVWDVGQVEREEPRRVTNYRTFKIYKQLETENYGCSHTNELNLEV
jgi:hypothetical protein